VSDQLAKFLGHHGSLDTIRRAPIRGRDRLELRFDGTSYPTHLDADDRTLRWDVPPSVARAREVADSYVSSLHRWSMGDHELWVFPKSARGPDRHALLLLDKNARTALSVEIDAHHSTAGTAHSIRIRRGAIDGPVVYNALRAFAPAQDSTGAALIRLGAVTVGVDPRGRSTVTSLLIDGSREQLTGSILRSGPLSVLPWRAPAGAGVMIWAGGAALSFGSEGRARLGAAESAGE